MDLVETSELASDGYSIYLPAISMVSTNSAGSITVINSIPDGEGLTLLYGDYPVEADDIVHIYGTSGGAGDGYYTIASIINDTSFSVKEPINNSTGGFVDFIWPVGALGVGFDSERDLHM